MKQIPLGRTDIMVSEWCLGTMTFGNQTAEADAHNQMDRALEAGINFFDTAEMYPVPASPETQGRTSKIIGSWFKKTGNREKVVLASKIVGRTSDYTAHIRTTGLSLNAITVALDAELKRLQTDYIDLYQIHWPERLTNTFGVRDFKPSQNDPWTDNFNEVLHSLQSFIEAGKIRAIGISNEKLCNT